MPHESKPIDAAAYGGPGWVDRSTCLREELGGIWAACGIDSEWAPLRAVLLHRPGPELAASAEPDSALMLATLDLGKAQAQHNEARAKDPTLQTWDNLEDEEQVTARTRARVEVDAAAKAVSRG